MPEIDFDTLDLPTTGTLPIGVPGADAEAAHATVSSRAGHLEMPEPGSA